MARQSNNNSNSAAVYDDTPGNMAVYGVTTDYDSEYDVEEEDSSSSSYSLS